MVIAGLWFTWGRHRVEANRHQRDYDQWRSMGQASWDWQVTPEQRYAEFQQFFHDRREWIVPHLMDDLLQRDSFLDRFVRTNKVGWLNFLVRRTLFFGGNTRRSASVLREKARIALRYLGTNAEPAIPILLGESQIPTTGGENPEAEAISTLTTLIILGQTPPAVIQTARLLTNSVRIANQVGSLVVLVAASPTDSIPRETLRQVLLTTNLPVIRCIPALAVMENLGPLAAPAAPILKAAVAKSYLDWPLTALNRAAHAIWAANGDAELAVQAAERTWAEYDQNRASGLDTDSLNAVSGTLQTLGSIPEVAEKMLPRILTLPEGPVRAQALKFLEPIPGSNLKPVSP